jgi:hypothetical protein
MDDIVVVEHLARDPYLIVTLTRPCCVGIQVQIIFERKPLTISMIDMICSVIARRI